MLFKPVCYGYFFVVYGTRLRLFLWCNVWLRADEFILETFTHYFIIVSCTCVYLCDRRVKMCHSTTCRRCCIKSLMGRSTSWWQLQAPMHQPPCQVSQSPLPIVTPTVDKSNYCICLARR